MWRGCFPCMHLSWGSGVLVHGWLKGQWIYSSVNHGDLALAHVLRRRCEGGRHIREHRSLEPVHGHGPYL